MSRDEIIELAKGGMRPKAIAQKAGDISPDHVSMILKRARMRGEKVPFFRRGKEEREDGPLTIKLRPWLCAALAPHAARRGITETTLAQRLLLVAAEANLVDAILDDGAGG